MKRQIMKGLMAFCAGVMTLCAASSLVVSCDVYDDSELRNQISALDTRVKNLEAIKEQLAALTARVDALYTLTFQVTDANELQYSFDGGKTWTSTGVVLAAQCEHECPPCQYVPCEHECPQVSLVDNGDTVTIKIGDAEFTIEKPQEIVFEIRAGKVYFESESTMKVAIKSSGIEDITVMAAPKGWYAEINSEGMVEITAPNYEDCQEGYGWDENDEYYEIPAKYAASGYVKIHACSVDGKCMVGKLPVEVAGQPLIVKAYAGNAYFTLAGTASWYNATFYYGVSEKANLEADTADLLERMNNGDWSLYDDYPSNWGEETDIEVAIADLLGEEPQVGKEYVVWAAVENSEAMPYDTEDLVLAYYSPVNVAITENEAAKTAFNVEVTVDVQGADSYVAVAMPESQLQWTSIEDIQDQMAMAMAEGMYYGKLYTESYTGSALDIAAGTSYSMSGNYSPNSDVYVFILPIDGRSKEDYTPADVVYGQFTTAALVSGGAIDLTATQVTSYMGEVYDYEIWDYVMQEIHLDPYTQLGVEVTPSATADWSAFYYTWMDAATYADYGAYEEDLVDYLLLNSYPNSPAEISAWPVYLTEQTSPATTMHFVAFIVDQDGKYGKIAHVEATTKELVKADLVWAEPFTTNIENGILKNTQTLKFTPVFEDGKEAASYKYVLAQTKYYNQYEGMDDAQMAEELYFSTSSSVKTVSAEELVNGVLYVDGHSYGYPYYFAIVPIDAEGNPGASAAIIEYETVFELDEAVTEGAAFEATMPKITLNLPPVDEFYPDGGWGDAAYYGYEDQSEWGYGYHYYYEIGFAVAPVEGTEVIAQYVDTQSYTLGETAAAKAGQLWSESLGFGAVTATEPTESPYKYFDNYWDEPAPAIVFCVSWKDAEGTVYYMDIDVQPELQKLADRMTDMINGGASEEPAALSVEGKQWAFDWTEYAMMMEMEHMSSCIDLGVSVEGYFMAGIDYEALYGPEAAGMWMAGVEGYYEIEATDATSGVIKIMAADWETGDLTYSGTSIEYSNLTETTCTFNGTGQFEGLFTNVQATLMTENVTVQSQGIAM
ncbi:MAG: hypothetical protein J6S01_01110 [Bacteroidales bacterium]|nr:hypothetical protein [Bacteroidales bacterium]